MSDKTSEQQGDEVKYRDPDRDCNDVVNQEPEDEEETRQVEEEKKKGEGATGS
jgi:hypothetical protein